MPIGPVRPLPHCGGLETDALREQLQAGRVHRLKPLSGPCEERAAAGVEGNADRIVGAIAAIEFQ